VKDLGQHRYFFGIEVAHGAEGIVLSQKLLDLLKETDMLGHKPTITHIDQKTRLNAKAREPVD
jgi:hypothetical protein